MQAFDSLLAAARRQADDMLDRAFADARARGVIPAVGWHRGSREAGGRTELDGSLTVTVTLPARELSVSEKLSEYFAAAVGGT